MTDLVSVVPNGGWDKRIHVCHYELSDEGTNMAMYVFVVVCQRYVVVVDTLVNAATGAQLARIAQTVGPGRQLLVLNTHADFDHAWGNQVFDGLDVVVPIIATRRCAARLRDADSAADLAARRAAEPERYADVRLLPPSVLFDDELLIDGGDLILHVLATPGHTADHCAVVIPEISTVLAGDLVETPFPFVEDVLALRASFERIAAFAPKVVLGCHVPPVANAVVLEQNRAYFAEVERRCRMALVAGIVSQPTETADLAEFIGFPFEQAIGAGQIVEASEFYKQAHQRAIRATLAALAKS